MGAGETGACPADGIIGRGGICDCGICDCGICDCGVGYCDPGGAVIDGMPGCRVGRVDGGNRGSPAGRTVWFG
jgi:hypothetical protein